MDMLRTILQEIRYSLIFVFIGFLLGFAFGRGLI